EKQHTTLASQSRSREQMRRAPRCKRKFENAARRCAQSDDPRQLRRDVGLSQTFHPSALLCARLKRGCSFESAHLKSQALRAIAVRCLFARSRARARRHAPGRVRAESLVADSRSQAVADSAKKCLA